jgi:hypothetical protein
MNQTPLVWCPAGGRGQNVGSFEIAVHDPGVVSHREGPQHVSQDRTHRHLSRLPMVHQLRDFDNYRLRLLRCAATVADRRGASPKRRFPVALFAVGRLRP